MKKRILSAVIAISMVLSVIPAFSLSASAVTSLQGSGSEEDPWRISSAAELEFFRDEVNDYLNNGTNTSGKITASDYVIITNNITLSGDWVPIDEFYGTLDGRNHTISGMTMSVNQYVAGFINILSGQGIVRNLHFTGGQVQNDYTNGSDAMGTGGVVGYATDSATISNCSFNGTIKGYVFLGGVVAICQVMSNQQVYVSDCWAKGDLVTLGSSIDYAAGIVSHVFFGDEGSSNNAIALFERCYSTMSVSSSNNRSGSFIGSVATGKAKFIDCYTVDSNSNASFIHTLEPNSSAEFSQCHVYDNTKGKKPYVTLNNSSTSKFTATNSYQLHSNNNKVNPTASNVYGKTETDYKNLNNFTNWSSSTWKINSSVTYPILVQNVDDSFFSRELTYYDGSDNQFNLPDYFDLILDEEKEYTQENRFNYTVTVNPTQPEKVWNPTAYQWDNGSDITLASTSGDKLILDPNMPVGTYKINVHAEDKGNMSSVLYGDFDMEFTITKKAHVPVPEVTPLSTPRPTYSPALTLDSIKITDGWKWDNINQVPKNSDGINSEGAADPLYKSAYDVFYAFDSSAPIAAGANLEDYYDLTDLDAECNTNGWTYTITTSPDGILLTALDPLVETSSEAPYTIRYIEVRDADTHAPVSGATVTCVTADSTGVLGTHHYPDEFPKGSPSPDADVTNSSGQVYAELSPGIHKLKASASGYDDGELEVDITPALIANLSSDPIIIYLRATRADFHVPKLLIKQEDGTKTNTPVPMGKISITSLDTSHTMGWNGGAATMLADPDTDLTGGIPNGVAFMLKNATDGYSSDEVLYVKATGNVAAFYTNEACTIPTSFTGDPAIYALELNDPVYIVTIDNGPDKPSGAKTVTATVSIKNIKATEGSFGLKYDTDVFTLANPAVGGDIALSSNIAGIMTVEDEYALYTSETWDDSHGYYVFEWHTADNNTELDAEASAKELLTITFTLKDNDDADSASYDWFDIMLWGDTLAAQDYAAAIAAIGDPNLDDMINTEHWRVVDSENDPPYGRGRLDRSKDVVNGVHKGGFYQASVNGTLGTDETSFFYDVTTIFDYKMPLNNSILQFHTYEQGDVTAHISGADVTIYNDLAPSFSSTLATGSDGIARFNVNTATGVYGPDFKYTVSALGYWPVPLAGDPLPSVYAPTGVVTRVPVPMERKVYHVPKVVNTPGMTTVSDADLGGERYAYNGRDFHFRARAASGYRITSYPQEATVHIISYDGSQDVSVTLNAANGKLDAYGIFTLDAQYLYQQTLLDVYNESSLHNEYGDLLVRDTTLNIIRDYPALSDFDPADYPDVEGFRSYNVYITFDQFEAEEIEYIVEGVTNDYGTVQYAETNPNLSSGLTILPLDSGTNQTDHYKLVKTTKYESGVSVTNRRTGTFTFAANPGCKVERVYINGLRERMYDGSEGFDYTFNEVDMDCNITVIFTDGDTPTRDSVITLVVGDYGHVDTLQPNLPEKTMPEENLWMTRRVYLKPANPLVFTATPDSGYELCPVRYETDGTPSSFAPLSPDGAGRYTVNPVDNENIIVYVTFKHPTASPNTTPNRFVKSYVYEGEGVPDPAGVLIYTIYDDIDIFQRANTAKRFKAKGVVLQPFDDLTTVTSTYDHPLPLQDTNTYTYPSIREDIAIGSVFKEPAYKVTGKVDLGQGTNLTTVDCQTGAIVKFVRLEDDFVTERPFQVPYVFNTTNARRTATFTAEIPIGHWNVYIIKPGYMIYKLKNFEMTEPAGDSINFGNGRTIVPYIGSTTTGKQITLTDAANVKSGWRVGVNASVKAQADVNDDGSVSVYDITYVWHNYNRRYVVQDYSYFEIYGSDQTITGPV